MDRRELLAASGALVALALAGCTTDDPDPDSDPDADDGDTDDSPSGEPTVDDERLAQLAADNAVFALDLHDQIAVSDGGNQFFSPYSISVALAMTFAGARGDTREEMRETLRYTLGEDVHPAFDDLRAALESRKTTTDPVDEEEVDAFGLEVASALWGREGFPFAEAFLATLEEQYGAGLRRADFAGDAEGERERINSWIADATEERIEDLLPPGSITPQTVLVLTNAIYFLAIWRDQFDPADTEDGTFTALDGSESTVPFMSQELRTNHASLPGAEAVELPYVGEAVSMVLILPNEGEFEAFERDLDADTLFGIFDELSDARGTVAMPKFEIDTGLQLSDTLQGMGMSTAFSSGANFAGMVEGDGGGPWIDEVYHDAFVTVDEEGTGRPTRCCSWAESPTPASPSRSDRGCGSQLLCLVCVERLADGQLPACDPAGEVGSDRSVPRALLAGPLLDALQFALRRRDVSGFDALTLQPCDVHRGEDVPDATSAHPQVGGRPRLVDEFHRDVLDVVDDLRPDEPRAVTDANQRVLGVGGLAADDLRNLVGLYLERRDDDVTVQDRDAGFLARIDPDDPPASAATERGDRRLDGVPRLPG